MRDDSRGFGLLRSLARGSRLCAKRKRNRRDAIAFRIHECEELLAMADRTVSGTYRPEPARVFVTERPKHREVHVPAHRDRVVRHLLHDRIESVFEANFCEASFACRRGKGTLAAAKALRRAMWNASRHAHKRVLALQMDVRNFFGFIHKPTLIELLEPNLRALQGWSDEPVALSPMQLAKVIVAHDPTQHARRLSPPRLFAKFPAHKRLGAAGPVRGLPIGNLTSQF
ncbi:MAG: hypothetical protein MUF54_24495, partial [Polyangiaceae bacterium]|nr:hypothetical protein [Polyangiaceae bacterium]